MSLLAHYKLNGDAADASGNGHDGTPTDVSWVAGKIGQAGSFNGTSSRIALPFSMSASSRTFCLWAKASSDADAMIYLFDASPPRTLFSWKSDGDWQLGYYDGSWGKFGSPPAAGQWHHIAFVLDADAGTGTCYIDGEQYGEVQSYTPIAVGGTKHLGSYYSGNGAYFPGLIDDVRFYDEALAQWRIKVLYNEGDGTETDIFGPYRVEEAQPACTGAEAGGSFCTGAAVGQDYHRGAEAGQVD